MQFTIPTPLLAANLNLGTPIQMELIFSFVFEIVAAYHFLLASSSSTSNYVIFSCDMEVQKRQKEKKKKKKRREKKGREGDSG